MANEQNLIPVTKRSPREQKLISSKGGKACAEARKRRKTMAETINILMSMEVKEPKLKAALERLGIDGNEQTNQMALMVSMWQKAMKGSEQAAIFIRDTAGEKPVDKLEQTTDLSVSEKQKNAVDDIIKQMKPVSKDEM